MVREARILTQNQSCAKLVTRENGLEIGKESTEPISTTGQIIQPQAQIGWLLGMLAWEFYGRVSKRLIQIQDPWEEYIYQAKYKCTCPRNKTVKPTESTYNGRWLWKWGFSDFILLGRSLITLVSALSARIARGS